MESSMIRHVVYDSQGTQRIYETITASNCAISISCFFSKGLTGPSSSIISILVNVFV
ncbi:hypothetical protein X975_13349, partial [Stegodyphus mimosarum]